MGIDDAARLSADAPTNHGGRPYPAALAPLIVAVLPEAEQLSAR